MFFYLSKLLTIFIDPLFVFLFVLLFLILKIKQNRLIRNVLLAAWFIFSISSTKFIANGLLDKLERAVVPVKLEQSYEGVVVLSGMLHLNISSKSQLEFSRAADRILKGIELVKNGVAKKLLISGGTGSLTNPLKSEATLLAEFAIRQGVPKDKIIVEANSRNTYENAVETE
ncbi:MAG: YdcF family protein, partial [Proteobacteria bacterium]|nr:YdcF family protein [Pseudomonadota bacterium]